MGRALKLQHKLGPGRHGAHLLQHILFELAIQVGQEGFVGVHNDKGTQRLLQGLGVALADGARQLNHRLHLLHAGLDVLIASLSTGHLT